MPATALTTTFTPSASCLVDVTRLGYTEKGAFTAQYAFYHLGVDSSTSDCVPSGWSDSTSAYFSPGICPSGYDEACASVVGSETIATCCPTGYTCQLEDSLPWYTTDLCYHKMNPTDVVVFTTYTLGFGNVVSTVSGLQGAVNAFGVRIRYQATDFISATASSSSSSSALTTSSSSNATSVGASGGSGGGGGGLSVGVKAGIGIGVSVSVLAALGFALFFFIRKRRRAAGEAAGAAAISSAGVSGGGGNSGGVPVEIMTMAGHRSGVAYTAVSQGSPGPEPQKYSAFSGPAVSISDAATPMTGNLFEAPAQATNYSMPPVELPGQHSLQAPQ